MTNVIYKLGALLLAASVLLLVPSAFGSASATVTCVSKPSGGMTGYLCSDGSQTATQLNGRMATSSLPTCQTGQLINTAAPVLSPSELPAGANLHSSSGIWWSCGVPVTAFRYYWNDIGESGSDRPMGTANVNDQTLAANSEGWALSWSQVSNTAFYTQDTSPPPPPPPPAVTQCNDGKDNDGVDGADQYDWGCYTAGMAYNPSDNSEATKPYTQDSLNSGATYDGWFDSAKGSATTQSQVRFRDDAGAVSCRWVATGVRLHSIAGFTWAKIKMVFYYCWNGVKVVGVSQVEIHTDDTFPFPMSLAWDADFKIDSVTQPTAGFNTAVAYAHVTVCGRYLIKQAPCTPSHGFGMRVVAKAGGTATCTLNDKPWKSCETAKP